MEGACSSNASDISYQQIRDNCWYGIYGGFNVVLMKDCGYVNASKLCADGGKRLYNWMRSKASQALIRDIEEDLALGDSKTQIQFCHSNALQLQRTMMTRDLYVVRTAIQNWFHISPFGYQSHSHARLLEF